MAKLRHIALSVKDLEASAKFYEDAFEMKRMRQSDVATATASLLGGAAPRAANA